MNQQQQQHQPKRRSSTSSEANPSAFDVIQKLLLDPMSACYAETAYSKVEDSNIQEWSGHEASSASRRMRHNRSLDSYYYKNHPEAEEEEDDDDEVTLNGLIDDAMSHKSTKTASTYMMAREHSSSSRNSSGSEYGIPILRDLPSFGTSSFMSSMGSSYHSPSRFTTVSRSVSETSSLISECEGKLPNINTMRKPINPALLP